MHALFRLISRTLLLVMLATVLNPSFGFEAVPSLAEQEHAVMLEMHDQHAGHEMSASEQANAACCADVQHQCCLGHQLAHPQGIAVSLILPEGSAIVPLYRTASFLSRVPDGLERPPRSLSV